ncbi:hypothetical protein P4133_21475 [Pseudomonas aeruginosa]|nr:hypothetical protein [Pseudomonas aeruginosa]
MTDVAGMALPVIGHRWIGMGRAERSAFRSLVWRCAASRSRYGCRLTPTT